MQLRVKIAKQQAAKEQKLRKKNLTKYIPNAAYAIYRVLQSMSETPAVSPRNSLLQIAGKDRVFSASQLPHIPAWFSWVRGG